MNKPVAPLVYLFQKNTLLVKTGTGDKEAVKGIDRESCSAFGDVRFYEAPPQGPPSAFIAAGAELPPGWQAVPIRKILGSLASIDGDDDGDGAERLLRAYHILQWRTESVYCGSCGAKNEDAEEPARRCPRCGRVEFPRISPAIIVLITREDGRALLAHNKNFEDNLYSLIAGFNEAGESLETTLEREVAEEVKIRIKDIRYIKSQSWPFPNSLMAGFTASWAGGEIQCDGVEITSARWFTRESVQEGIVRIPQKGSVSRCLIDRWIGGV
ncbi:MAG: NAD(+) diphosphatase [Treponema sp.]|jgi:NAD+ diphosphatase|nr:NAD(+) diphosphatase [Treponema sp.]